MYLPLLRTRRIRPNNKGLSLILPPPQPFALAVYPNQWICPSIVRCNLQHKFFLPLRCILQSWDFDILNTPFFCAFSSSHSPYSPLITFIMSAKSIHEADGKAILNYHLTRAPVIKPTPLPPSSTHNPPPLLASLQFPEDNAVKDVLDQAEVTYPWLLAPGAKFVAKPDQLIKRRGKSGLLALNKTWAEAREWIEARANKDVQVETVTGVLRTFLVEPFVPHSQDCEYYVCINSVREVSTPLLHINKRVFTY